jgi:hypothetical protein
VYNIYVITLAKSGSGKHRRSAQDILGQTLSSCQRYNWNVNLFDAINGYTLDQSIWRDQGLAYPQKSKNNKKGIGDLPGAQGCFLSHYTLWNCCIELNQPIIVLEDDAEIIAPLNHIVTEFDLLKLHRPRAPGQTKLGDWSTGAFAYWINPVGAKKLVNFSKQNGPVLADKIIASNVINWNYLTPPVAKLGSRIGSSTQPEKYPYRF